MIELRIHSFGNLIEAKPERQSASAASARTGAKKPRKEEAHSGHERAKAGRPRREREPEVEGPTEPGEWNGPVPSFLNLSAL